MTNNNNLVLKNVRFVKCGFEHWPISKYLEIDIFDGHENMSKILAWRKTNNIENSIAIHTKRTLYRNDGLIGGIKFGMKSFAKVLRPDGGRFALRKLKKGAYIDIFAKTLPANRKQELNFGVIGIVTKIIVHENNTNNQPNQ